MHYLKFQHFQLIPVLLDNTKHTIRAKSHQKWDKLCLNSSKIGSCVLKNNHTFITKIHIQIKAYALKFQN